MLRSDLHALLDRLTAMHAGLVPLWNPDATIHPLWGERRRAARDALHAAIADLTIWIER